MPSPTTITVNDRAATPVAFDFDPAQRRDGVQYFVNSDGVKIADKTISISQRQLANKYKPRVVVAIPVVQSETINGVVSPKVVRTGYFTGEFSFDKSSTEQERKDLVGFVYDLFGAGQTGVDPVLTGLEFYY
jgi:hypothetical protein